MNISVGLQEDCSLEMLPEEGSTNQKSPRENKITLDSLQILKILGIGTYGAVKLTRHIPTGQSYALKVLSKQRIVSMRQQKHILREKIVHQMLDHPFIVPLYATLQDENCLYLVEEYLSGGELYRVLYSGTGELTLDEGGLRLYDVKFYMGCILLALEYIHKMGIIYRDLKLENIVLDWQGFPKLVDFGFSKPHASETKNLTMCGSIEYMAPEVLLHRPHDTRADIWAIGIVMYELLTGCTPFFHENRREQGRLITEEPVHFPEGFEEKEQNTSACSLVRKLLEKNPEERPASIEEIQSHPFFLEYFSTLNPRERLLSRHAAPPFVPYLSSPYDSSFFEEIPDEYDDVEPFEEDGNDWYRDF